MATKEVKIGEFTFDVMTERVTQVEVNQSLYNLLVMEDGEGCYNTHRSSYKINSILEDIEEDGLEEYTGISNSDIELLRACKSLLDNDEVDAINFV